ncbi:S66 peptidase family protein [Paenisporosarcina sp. FSL H8-0542]|uniref:S66 family peptidase n=1 Tax=Paenisporosarcina sp. FSL H8-0542 TaxID=2921401 RepID=UPI0031599C4D
MTLLNRLRKGDKIGIYSPSSPITYSSPKRFQRAKSFLESKGFEIIEGNLTGKQDYYRSGTIQERADELNELIRNPEIMIGYSDATAILLGIYAQTGIPTFYGPALVPSFGEFEPFLDLTYDYFKEMLIEEQSLPYIIPTPSIWTDEPLNWEVKTGDKVQRDNEWVCVNEGVAHGRLVGGNLNAMYGIWGSPYVPDIQQGDIILLEDTMKTASVVEKNFTLLKLNGVFEKVSGILLGKHELFDDQGTGRTPYDILLEVMGNKDIPILADFDCCHTHPMLTLPIGINVELDATNRKVKIMEKWIK